MATHLKQAYFLLQLAWIVDEASWLVELHFSGKREGGRFDRKAGKAD